MVWSFPAKSPMFAPGSDFASAPSLKISDLLEDWAARVDKPAETFITSDLGGKPKVVASGRAVYDVHWSTVINTARKLTKPQVQDIQFIEVVWG